MNSEQNADPEDIKVARIELAEHDSPRCGKSVEQPTVWLQGGGDDGEDYEEFRPPPKPCMRAADHTGDCDDVKHIPVGARISSLRAALMAYDEAKRELTVARKEAFKDGKAVASTWLCSRAERSRRATKMSGVAAWADQKAKAWDEAANAIERLDTENE